MSQENLVKNTTFFTIAMAIQKILSFVYFIFVARFIGVENTGKYSFVMGFTTIFAMFLDFGLSQILIRESARDKNNSQKYLANVLGLKVIGAIIIYGLVVLTINLMNYPDITKQMVYVAGLVMLIDSFTSSFYSVLRGHQNLKFESYGVVTNQFIILIIGLIVLKLNLGLVVLIGVYLVGSLFNLFYSSTLLKIKLNILPKIRWNFEIIKKLLKLALPFAIAGFFIRMYSTMDIILLSKLADDEAVGLYSVAYKITFALQFVAVAFSASIYPAFCKYFVQSKEKLARSFTKSMYYLMILALPTSVGVIVLAEKIIGPVFGFEYAPAVLPLQIMMAALVLVFISFPIGALLNACNRQTRQTVHLGIVAVFNIVINIFLIIWLSYVGAAISVLLSMLLLNVLGIIVVEKITAYDKKYLIVSLIRILFSCLVMGIIVLLLKNYFHFLLVSAIGALIYFIILYLIKGFTKDDILQIKTLLLDK